MRVIGPVIRKLLPDLIFPFLFLAFGVYVFIVSFGYQFETRAFAHGTGSVLVLLSGAVIVREVVRVIRQEEGDHGIRPAPVEIDISSLLFGVAWCVAFLVLIMVVGFDIATPVWVFVLLLWHRVARAATLLIPLVLWALVKFALEEGFDTVLFKGILFGDKLPRFW